MARRAGAILGALVLVVLIGCSGRDEPDDGGRGSSTTMRTIERPDGPAAQLAELTGGHGIDLVSTQPVDLAAAGYTESEWKASGTATSYEAVGELPADGTFELAPDATDDYATRIVVRRPTDAADFNGTVLLEWLNVSGGIDASPDWTYTAAEVLRGGYVWVGISAQQIGIQGGEAAIAIAAAPKGGIKASDPERYADLQHPGDAFSYDIYTQVARALRDVGDDHPLAGLEPERLLALGESQSAFCSPPTSTGCSRSRRRSTASSCTAGAARRVGSANPGGRWISRAASVVRAHGSGPTARRR